MRYINGRVLIIPDIHQDLQFANIALEETFDHVVFLGDYFDTFRRRGDYGWIPARGVCEWLNAVHDKYDTDARVTWLLGNHDLAYIAAYKRNDENPYYTCPGWNPMNQVEFDETISRDWIDAVELCVNVNGFVLSHAGFCYNQFNKGMGELQNIEYMYDDWQATKWDFMKHPWHWIGDRGQSRGGIAVAGSPIWLSYDREFYPVDTISQIVGHDGIPHFYLRNKTYMDNNNYCIDCRGRMYAISKPNGLYVKDVENNTWWKSDETGKENEDVSDTNVLREIP